MEALYHQRLSVKRRGGRAHSPCPNKVRMMDQQPQKTPQREELFCVRLFTHSLDSSKVFFFFPKHFLVYIA
jgi:hypothetical protein